MTEKQILDKKQYGDISQVAQMIGVSRHNATQLLRRPGARRHNDAIEALQKVIDTREKLIKDNNNDNN